MLLKTKDRVLDFGLKLLLLFFLVIGCVVYNDYGISWDESFSYNECGMTAWNAVVHGFWSQYQANPEKYHGPAFELVLILIQKITGTEEVRNVYLLRHFLTFLLFWFSGLAVYKTIAMRFSNRFILFAGICWYFMMPRIFADAFYNSKDLAFLSMIAISLYAMFRFIMKPGYITAAILGLCIGFTTSIRVMGVIMILLTLMNFIAARYITKNNPGKQYHFGPLVVVLLATVVFTITFWPILWLDPLGHFQAAWNEMSSFTFRSNVLYLGEQIPAPELPWHYLPVWIAITTPLPYLLFFSVGLFASVTYLASNRSHSLQFFHNLSICALFFLPIASIILLDSVVYDGWRHIFFVYVPFCLIALEGLNYTMKKLSGWRAVISLRLFVVFITCLIGYEMVKIHPYQNVYFNRLAGNNKSELASRFEMDYWGLSYREALEKVLEKDKRDSIRIYTLNNPGYLNAFILPESSRNRIVYTGSDDFEYFITNFRSDTTDHSRYHLVDSIIADGAMISGTFILK